MKTSTGNAVTVFVFLKLTLETPQERSLFETNAGNAVAVFVFQNEHWKRCNSVRFSKLTLEMLQQCWFFKTNARNVVVVFVFQKEHWKGSAFVVASGTQSDTSVAQSGMDPGEPVR